MGWYRGQNFAEATLTAAAKEAEATLPAEGFLPPEKPDEDEDSEEPPPAEK